MYNEIQIKKKPITGIDFFFSSGQQDLNLRPLGPQPSALPSYAIPRNISIILEMFLLVKRNFSETAPSDILPAPPMHEMPRAQTGHPPCR